MPTTVIINPGTGPVANATEQAAYENVIALVKDALGESMALGPSGDTARIARDLSLGEGTDEGGRFSYVVTLGDRTCAIDMPGIALERVRYTGADGQNIWHFPRLYVDGSSWVWMYAVEMLREALTGAEDD